MTAEALRDAAARERALDATASFIVQAPAGSGKTGLLTRRFLRLLATVDRPEEIVAITFTRKAAAEMRLRIVSALQRARDGKTADSDFESAVLSDARHALERDTQQGWGLVDAPSRLQIMTLDALNARLVSAMPVTTGTARVRIVEGVEQTALYEEAAAALLDWLAVRDRRGDAARRFFDHLDASGMAWQRHIVTMLARRDQWLGVLLRAGNDREALRDESERSLAQLVAVGLQHVDGLMPAELREPVLALLRRADDRLTAAGKDPGPALPEHWPSPEIDALAFWRRLASALLTKQGTWRKSVTVAQGFPPKPEDAKADKDAFLSHLEAMADDALAEALQLAGQLPDPHYSDAQWETIEALLDLLPLAAAELERILTSRGLADYTALAARAVNALGDGGGEQATDLALRLDYRVRHILVDEMQDTAPAQYRLLEGLTAGWEDGDGRTLFCVGDPMQSIYRFRGADVSLFLQAWSEGIGALPLEQLVLSTNFRSEAGIIDWVNDAFAQILGASNDPLTDAVAYAPADVGPGAGEGGSVTWHLGIDAAQPTADDVVALVTQLHARHPNESIGVLARTRGALEPILEGLRKAGVACEALDIDRLTGLPEIIDLLNLTRAIEHPFDRLSWLGLLRSPLLGWTLEDIDRFVIAADARPDGAPVPDLLRDPECTAHLDPETTTLLRGFLGAYEASTQAATISPLRDRVERLWCALGGPAALADAEAAEHAWLFLDTVSRLERQGQLDSLPGLVPALDALRVTRQAQEPRVFAMTIFRSKGLEFDHVVMPALQATTRRNERPPLLFDLRSQAHRDSVLFSTVGTRQEAARDALHDLLWHREQARTRNELDRLLYVAATRARRSLHLFGGNRRNKDGQLAGLSPDALLGRFGTIATDALMAAPDQRTGADHGADARDEPEWLPSRCRRIERPWRAPELPSPTGDTRFSGKPVTDPVEFDWAGSGARHVGTVVHAWLHELAGCGDPANRLGQIPDRDTRSRALLAELGVAAADLDDHVARVNTALRGATGSAEAAWLIGSAGPEDRAEFALGTIVDGTVTRLVIDRLVRDDAGALWIVDYKTSRHEGGDLEGFFANECRRYRSQLETYAQAVEHWYAHTGQALGPLRLGLFFTQYGRLVPLTASD